MGSTLSAGKLVLYQEEKAEREKEFRALADLYVSGVNSKDYFNAAMRASLREYYVRLALIGKDGRNLTERDRQDVSRFLSTIYKRLDNFMGVLPTRKELSDAQILHRAASYGPAWGVLTRFALPAALADALPALPGFDCLGMSLCGCWLEWQAGLISVEVYWHLNPLKEHCVLCVGFTAEWSPLVIPLDEIDPDLLEEDSEFFYEE